LIERQAAEPVSVSEAVRAIIALVRTGGDRAVRDLTLQFDGVDAAIEVPPARLHAAVASLPSALRAALERAIRNLTTAHRAMLPSVVEVETEPGVIVRRRPLPVERVGVYAPGGRASYPSSVLMGVVPAKVAGCREVIVASPPGPDGSPSSLVMAAALLAEADGVVAVGGAQAIAALAYGTETIPRVDRIVGPGNAYVAEAKLQVASRVAIDSPAGPSELVVVADASASPETIAVELVAQAEHDPDAVAIAVVIRSDQLAASVVEALRVAVAATPREDIVRRALATRGGVLIAASLDEAAAFAAEVAPEHLLLATAHPDADRERFPIAGALFIGASSSVAFGDYLTGGNHVLPTGGLARSYSGLSTFDFFRWTSEQRIDRGAAASLAPDVALLAAAEGLPAHGAAALAWAGSGIHP
jgi:histidinol dehydrogenase